MMQMFMPCVFPGDDSTERSVCYHQGEDGQSDTKRYPSHYNRQVLLHLIYSQG